MLPLLPDSAAAAPHVLGRCAAARVPASILAPSHFPSIRAQNFARHIEQHEALVKAAEESEKGSGPAPPAETIMMVETLVRQEGCPSIGALARDAQPVGFLLNCLSPTSLPPAPGSCRADISPRPCPTLLCS